MLDQTFQRFPGEVEAVDARLVLLKFGDHAERLGIVVEAAGARHGGVQSALAGMAERRMAEIMGERERLGQVLVDCEGTRESAGDLRDFQAVSKTGAIVIALVIDEDLGLVVEPPEGGGMQDAVAVAGEGGARGTRRLGLKPPPARPGIDRMSRKRAVPELGACDPWFCGRNHLALASLVD